jgi:flavin-dependent dehydrogenase
LLLDPKAPWEKPCGGGLTAAALDHTPELQELRSASESIAEVLVTSPSGASIVIPLRRPYQVVSRLTLSQWGLERATLAGVCFQSGAVRSAQRTNGGWSITDSAGHIHLARRVIAADGAASRLRGILAPRFRPKLAPTRVAYPRAGAPSGCAVIVFPRSIRGYLWDFPRPGHHSIGVGVTAGTSPPRGPLDEIITDYRVREVGDSEFAECYGAVIATSEWTSGCFEDLGGRDYALLGDAAGLADAATGEGLDYAFRSASLAAHVYDDAFGFVRYPAAAKTAFGRETRRARMARQCLYHPLVVDQLVASARRSRRLGALLITLVEAINEHRSLRRALASGPRGTSCRLS